VFSKSDCGVVARRSAGVLSSLVAVSSVFIAAAVVNPPAAGADEPAVTLELNKLEPIDKGCRAYMVVTNKEDASYEAFKLDLVLFQSDGVIGRRFSLDLAPVRPLKKAVKLFEIDGMACDKIGQFLINDVIDCKTETGGAQNCLQRLSTSSLTNVQLSK
jgi:hypothetical protein